LKTLANNIEDEMHKLKLWFDENKLSLNLNKTKFMIFSNKRKEEVSLSINNVNIEKVSEIRFLGVTLDEKLTWKSHILHIKIKMAKSLCILNKVKYSLPYNTMKMLYCSIILPYLNYCVEIWGNTYHSNTMPLYILQKRAIRIIFKAGYRDRTNPLFIRSGLLKFKDIVELQTLLVMFKARSKALPYDLQKLFVCTSEDGNHRQPYDFKHLTARTNLKQMCLSVAGVKAWNLLRKDLKSCKNILEFKKRYKKKQLELYQTEI